MTDTPDYMLARITEIQATIALNDLYIQIAVAVLISSLALFITLCVAERIKGGFESYVVPWVHAVSMFVAVIAALACAVMLYDNFTLNFTLDQLIAQYEAIYGPLPIR